MIRFVVTGIGSMMVGAVLLLFAPLARAEPAQRPRVELVIAASRDETQALLRVVEELLGRLSVDVRAHPVKAIAIDDISSPPPGRPYLARVFVDLRPPDHSVVWLVDAARDRVLIRDLERTSEELTREEIGHILETSIEGLLAGETIGVPRSEALPLLAPPKPPAPKKAVSPTAASWKESLQISAAYEVAILSGSGHFVHGPEADLFVALPTELALGVWVSGQYRVPTTVDATPVSARLGGGTVRAIATFDAMRSPRLRLRMGAGAGVDLVELTPRGTTSDTVAIAGSRLLTFIIARAGIALEGKAFPSVSWWARFALDLDFSDTSYVFERRAGEEVVLRPWPVRPALAAGVGFP